MTQVRRIFGSNNGLYTPTHIELTAIIQSDDPPFALKTVKTNLPMDKGKQREMRDEDFEKEREHLLLEDIQQTQEVPDADKFPQNQEPGDMGASVPDLDASPEDDGCLECGCCFSPAPFVRFPP